MSHIYKVMVNININQETIYTKIPHSQTCAALLVHFMLQPYIITYILQEIYKSHWIQNERHRNEIKQSIHGHTCTIILKHVFYWNSNKLCNRHSLCKPSPNTCTHTTKMAITSQPSTEAALNYMVVPEIKIVTLEFNAKII